MQDRYGRKITYLRLSVTDRCDFRCVYCMGEDMTFLPRKEVLSLEEMALVADAFTQLGVNKIRVTGGEPLVRQNVLSLIRDLGQLPLKDLALTTNGSKLLEMGTDLKTAGVKRINVSIDSLQYDRFKQITRHGDLDKVLAGIQHASTLGFDKIKLNTVVMRHFNSDEIEALVQFAFDRQFDISFIEEMPLGEVDDHSRPEELVSSEDILDRLKTRYDLNPTNESTGGPSRYWRAPGLNSRIGFISPMSHNFCDSCNRVRVSASGKLLLCLGNEEGVDLKPSLREYSGEIRMQKLKTLIQSAMMIKPERHYFDDPSAPQIVRFMNATGG